MTPHVIRLRGPWNCQPLARATATADGVIHFHTGCLPAAVVVPLPGEWSPALARPAELVRLTRRFGRPTGLTDGSRVFLAIAEIEGLATVRLNGRELGTIADASAASLGRLANLPPQFASGFAIESQPCPARWEIGPLLADRNEVAIDVLSPVGGRLGLVSLEIVH